MIMGWYFKSTESLIKYQIHAVLITFWVDKLQFDTGIKVRDNKIRIAFITCTFKLSEVCFKIKTSWYLRESCENYVQAILFRFIVWYRDNIEGTYLQKLSCKSTFLCESDIFPFGQRLRFNLIKGIFYVLKSFVIGFHRLVWKIFGVGSFYIKPNRLNKW